MEDAEGTLSPAPDSKSSKRKQVAVACFACQKRKSKCDGNRPKCHTCVKKSTECEFDADGDSRRTENLKRKVTALTMQAEETATAIKGFKATIISYEALIGSLKAAPRGVAPDILDALRTDATLDEVLEYCEERASAPPKREPTQNHVASPSQQRADITALEARVVQFEDCLRDLQTSAPETVLDQLRLLPLPPQVGSGVDFSQGSILDYRKDKSRSRNNGRLERRADMSFLLNPMVEVPKGSEYETWTNVIDEPVVVQRLIDIYFTWYHTVGPVFSEVLFRQDMIQGNNKYCSRVLVNAICSLACYLPGFKGAGRYAQIKNETAVELLKEAETLLHEAPEPSLTNIAALSIMAVVEVQRCRFGPAWIYSRQASTMTMYLGLNQSAQTNGTSHGLDICWTFWTVFQLDQFTSAVFGRSPAIILHNVGIDVPPDHTATETGVWPGGAFHGDGDFTVRPNKQSRYMQLASKLSRIVNTALDAAHATHYPYTSETAFKLYKEYERWYKELQSGLSLEASSPPQTWTLHAWYHSRVIALLKPLFDSNIPNAEIDVREICRNAAFSIAHLFLCYVNMFHLRGLHNQIGIAMFEACSIHARAWYDPLHKDKAQQCLERAVGTYELLQSRLPSGGDIIQEIKGLLEASNVDLGPHIGRGVYGSDEEILHRPVDFVSRKPKKPDWQDRLEHQPMEIERKLQRPSYDYFYKPRGT